MADSQFNPLGSVTAPADLSLPPSLNLQLKNVYASFDGSGAAGSFVPCLQIISDSGHTVGSYPCASTVAAGASADVSWFPSVGGSGAGGSGTFSGARIWSSTNQTVTSGSGGGFGTPLNFDTTIFDTGGYTNLGANPTRITIPATGYYEVGGCLAVALPGGAGFELQILVGLNGITNQIVSDAYAVPALGGPGSTASASVATLYHFIAGDYIQLVLAQFSGGNLDSASQSPLCPIFWITKA